MLLTREQWARERADNKAVETVRVGRHRFGVAPAERCPTCDRWEWRCTCVVAAPSHPWDDADDVAEVPLTEAQERFLAAAPIDRGRQWAGFGADDISYLGRP